jgi:transposase-like protein
MKRERGYHGACRVCTNSSVAEGERLLAMGSAATQVARRIGVSPESVRRHWRNHVSDERKARLRGRAIFNRDVDPQQLEELRARERDGLLLRLSVQRADLTALTKDPDKRVAVHAHGTLLRLHELVARVLGEIAPSSVTTTNTQVNLGIAAGDLLELRTLIETALRDEPRARAKLLSTLAAGTSRELSALEVRP